MEALQGIKPTILLCHSSLEKSDSSCTIPNRDCHGMDIRHWHVECCTRDCRTRRRKCYMGEIRSDDDERTLGSLTSWCRCRCLGSSNGLAATTRLCLGGCHSNDT